MNASDGGATQSGRCDSPQGRDERVLSPAARRALAEAEARLEQPEPEAPREINGRGGPDPVRYGDWEVKGPRQRLLKPLQREPSPERPKLRRVF